MRCRVAVFGLNLEELGIPHFDGQRSEYAAVLFVKLVLYYNTLDYYIGPCLVAERPDKVAVALEA